MNKIETLEEFCKAINEDKELEYKIEDTWGGFWKPLKLTKLDTLINITYWFGQYTCRIKDVTEYKTIESLEEFLVSINNDSYIELFLPHVDGLGVGEVYGEWEESLYSKFFKDGRGLRNLKTLLSDWQDNTYRVKIN